jgi:hypothetical protein
MYKLHCKIRPGFKASGPWSPTWLWNFKTSTFPRRSAHRWRWGCQTYEAAGLNPTEIFLIFVFVRSYVEPKAIVRLEWLGKLGGGGNPMTSSKLGPTNLRLDSASIFLWEDGPICGELSDMSVEYVPNKHFGEFASRLCTFLNEISVSYL